MQAGKLRHRVQLQRRGATKNAYGEDIYTWVTYATIWSSIKPLSGKEYDNEDKINADTTHEIRIRHIKGLVASDRILFGTRVFEINSIIRVMERNAMIIFKCKEGV